MNKCSPLCSAKRFGQTFLKFDAWCKSAKGHRAKERGGPIGAEKREERRRGHLKNIPEQKEPFFSLVKVSFAERKVLGGEKEKMKKRSVNLLLITALFGLFIAFAGQLLQQLIQL